MVKVPWVLADDGPVMPSPAAGPLGWGLDAGARAMRTDSTAMWLPLVPLLLNTILTVPMVSLNAPRVWKGTPPKELPLGDCAWLTDTVCKSVAPSETA